MEQIVIMLVVWAIVLTIIPLTRVKLLFGAAIVGLVWMILIDNISANLGYYQYLNTPISIGKAPLFQNITEAGLGILMLNWLKEKSHTKLIAVFCAGLLFVVLHSFYIQRGLFAYGSFDNILNFIFHIAALSIFTWTALAIVGEERVYSGRHSRLRMFSH